MLDQELARNLVFLEAYTLGLETMIGAEIFVLSGIVAKSAGTASMISFAIGSIVALLAALALSKLATQMFYFKFAILMFNMSTVANIRRAEAVGEDSSEGTQFTAGRFMQAKK